jgi:tetratricopeptide (TPR) repeat protein
MMSALVAFTFVSLGKAFYADVLAAKAMETSIGDADGITKMAKASAYMPYESRYSAYLSQIYLTMATQEVNKIDGVRDKDALKRYVESASTIAKVAQSQSPQDITVQEMVAQTHENTLFITGLNPDVLNATQNAYEQASLLEPHNPLYYLKLGQIKNVLAKSATGDDVKARIMEAQTLFERSITEKTDFILGYLNLGLLQESMGDSDAAIATLTKGVTLDHKSKDAQDAKYQLARLLSVRGTEDDLKVSESILQDLLAADDKNSNTYVTLGLVYEQTHRKDDAIKLYEKAMTLISNDENNDAHKQIQKFIDTVKAGKSNAPHAKDISQQPTAETAPESVSVDTQIVPDTKDIQASNPEN